MNITTRTGLVGFLLALSAFSISAANATTNQSRNSSPSIEGRLNRITAAIQQRESQWQDEAKPGDDILMARGFADGSRGGGWNQFARGGSASGPGGANFNNFHPAYGGGGGAWRDTGGFANGAYGGGGFVNGSGGGAGFVNGTGGGGGFVNGTEGGGGFVNGRYGGAGFRNW